MLTELSLRKRISKIRVFDPACGSGNFLVIAYKEMRKIEDEINSQLISMILSELGELFITDCGSYRNDGLIISPLNGSREIKVKPLSLHTIDVLNNGDFWQDREGNNLDFMIKDSVDDFAKDSIWRCYPTFNKNDLGNYIFD